MPSDPPNPVQWNLQGGWMAAYHEAVRRGQTPPIVPPPTPPSVKEEVMEEPMQGGWKFEGKERPVTPRICPKCQGTGRIDSSEEPDKSSWCEPCQEGRMLGHPPIKGKPPVKDKDVFNHTAFFGA